MFIDELTLDIQGGNGGDGTVAFFPMKRGPSGGDGGQGGTVYIKGDAQMADLHVHLGKKLLKAEDGAPGGTFNKEGKKGQDLVISVPLGTHVVNLDTNERTDISDEKTLYRLARGGKGGKGNSAFKSATNQTPRKRELGAEAQKYRFSFVLKLIADFGLIGIPSAGKSTLLNELTNADVKTAMYAFTTLEPNLGVCGDKVIADIPGLIEGASQGKGLGIKFLKHIEKVPILLHCIGSDSLHVTNDYQTIMSELGHYNQNLPLKKQYILLTKTDLLEERELHEKVLELQQFGHPVYPISIYNPEQMASLQDLIRSPQ